MNIGCFAERIVSKALKTRNNCLFRLSKRFELALLDNLLSVIQ